MKIISNTTDFCIEEKTAVAIGKFDGVHIGHRALLREIINAKEKGYKAAVFTFDPSPTIFFGLTDEKMLTTKEEKRKILEDLGIDYLVEYPLDKASAGVEPEQFIEEFLVKKMQAKYIVAGMDLSFGNRGRGNFALLNSMEEIYDYTCKVIEKIQIEGNEVSSTLIRKIVENGEMEKAERYLGIPYRIMGKVVHGAHIGSGLGMPTVNMIPKEEKILPPFGVYYSKVTIAGKDLCGITNIGRKPTVKDGDEVNTETFLYGFEGDLYGTEMELSLLKFRRFEKKFSDITALKKQMKEDVESGSIYFGLQ